MIMTDNLPRPQGWKILVRKDKPKAKTAGGIILADTTRDAESYMQFTGQVVALGPLAYHDRSTGEHWNGGDWCKVGDWIVMPKFTQFKLEIDDLEYRFINDDEVIAVLDDPSVIKVWV